MSPRERTELRLPSLGEPISHYTDGVLFGDLLFVSGCGATNDQGEIVSWGDPVAQTRKSLENMVAILHAAGTSIENVLKVTVYLTDVRDRVAINEVRKEFFGGTRPASTLIGVAQFALPGALVEIEAIASVPDEN
jgi:2-iminobutanoate/2-iminopropanoate deaminase